MDVWGAQWSVGQPMQAFLAASGAQVANSSGQALAVEELATLRALWTGEAVRHHEEIIRRPDGTSAPILFNAVALAAQMLQELLPSHEQSDETPDEQPDTAALIVLQDVTALKEAERLKDEFIAIAAHELKTPMAAVKGYADMLIRQSTRDPHARLADWQTEALETIDQATSRLVELTNDLLDVTRIQARRVQLHQEPHDLVALARRMIKRFQVTTDRHALSVEVESSEVYVVAFLDVGRTEQVLGNLLSNAIKYSPDGGPITIHIREGAPGGVAEMRVEDHGIGIPKEQQSQLFQRFARAENARELGIAGTGLGLYLCRELMELQGGRIWFTTAEGHGTTFYVTLPLTTE
jgi:signal transduction histidine kinase